MVFQGEVLSVAALLEQAHSASESVPNSDSEVRNTAARNAIVCRDLLVNGDTPDECWRFGILQTLDDYTSTLRRGGSDLASRVFTDEPIRTGSAAVDAGFAALADYLADRDGWTVPDWAADPSRRTTSWYPDVPEIFRADAEKESPVAFRRRGILITARSLARA